jgi:hypothetical protein
MLHGWRGRLVGWEENVRRRLMSDPTGGVCGRPMDHSATIHDTVLTVNTHIPSLNEYRPSQMLRCSGWL